MIKDFEILKTIQDGLIQEVSNKFKRNYFFNIDWESKMIGLIGERGVGKTTLMLQKMKETGKGFYFSADNSIIKIHGLFKFVYFLYKEYGIQDFYIDEIHKYSNWTTEIKNIYDAIPNGKIVFSGSSSLDLYKGILDLARRVDFYRIYPLNFSEFLKLFYNIDLPTLNFDEIIKNHKQITLELSSKLKNKYFQEYLNFGYYPFSYNMKFNSFVKKIQILLDKIILEDLPVFLDFKTISLDKLKKMFYFISNIPPSELSFTNLGKKIGLNKVVVENALFLLNKIGLISLIPKFGNLTERIRKEYKIFFGNPNLYNSYSTQINIGTLRECFIISQLRKIENTELFLPKVGDLILERFDEVFYFEIGGKNKKQNKYPKNTFIIKDNIIISENDKVIPLRIFGLLG